MHFAPCTDVVQRGQHSGCDVARCGSATLSGPAGRNQGFVCAPATQQSATWPGYQPARCRLAGAYLGTIPIGDAIIVLRSNGPKATVYGVHGATAVVLLATAALLFTYVARLE
jgi:hypothetical protein